MVNGRVVHPALSVPLRKRQSVIDELGRDAVIVGFRKQRSWIFGRPSSVSWVVVQAADGIRSYRAPSELRVVEKTAIEMEGQSA